MSEGRACLGRSSDPSLPLCVDILHNQPSPVILWQLGPCGDSRKKRFQGSVSSALGACTAQEVLQGSWLNGGSCSRKVRNCSAHSTTSVTLSLSFCDSGSSVGGDDLCGADTQSLPEA